MDAEPRPPRGRSARLGSRQGSTALTGYFDTSAVVKLLVREPDSDIAERLWTAARERTASVLLYVETRAALAAAQRAARISVDELEAAHADLDRLARHIDLIHVDPPLAQAAGDLAERHGLRGYDAVHLATALSVDDPDLVLVTWDRDLSAAARACGRAVAPVIV